MSWFSEIFFEKWKVFIDLAAMEKKYLDCLIVCLPVAGWVTGEADCEIGM